MTSLQRALEARHGQPLRDILIDALATRQTVRSAAISIGVSHKTVYRWSEQLGLDPAGEILKAKTAEAA